MPLALGEGTPLRCRASEPSAVLPAAPPNWTSLALVHMGRSNDLGEEVPGIVSIYGRSRLSRRRLLLRDNLVAEADTLVADVDARPTDQPAHLALRLPTERAFRRTIDPLRGPRTLLEHGPSVGPLAAGWVRLADAIPARALTVVGKARHTVRLRSQVGNPLVAAGVASEKRTGEQAQASVAASSAPVIVDSEPRPATRCRRWPAPRRGRGRPVSRLRGHPGR